MIVGIYQEIIRYLSEIEIEVATFDVKGNIVWVDRHIIGADDSSNRLSDDELSRIPTLF